MRLEMLVVAIALLASSPAIADAFDPLDFLSGGPFPSGGVTIDSTALTVGGVPWAGADVVAQPGGSVASVFSFDGDANVTGSVSLIGIRPVVILFRGAAAISGSWSVLAGRGTGSGTGEPNSLGGTGGGGFGGIGGNGANSSGGASYGDLFSELQAGSNGGSLSGSDAALSGGGVEIGALGLLDLAGASIFANGANGVTLVGDGLGGGSGGGIFLHAFTVAFDSSTVLGARGGRGGDYEDVGPFSLGYGGGGGGGGRIAVLWNELGGFDQGGATIQLSGGTGGFTEQESTQPGGQGAFANRSSPTIGVPEPGAAACGIAVLAALAWRARHASGAASSRNPVCTI